MSELEGEGQKVLIPGHGEGRNGNVSAILLVEAFPSFYRFNGPLIRVKL